MTMKETEETLPQNKFARIHKSVIVSLPKIEKVKGLGLQGNTDAHPRFGTKSHGEWPHTT